MKKVILAIVGIIVAALLVMPFLAGQKTQQTLDSWVAQVNQMGGYDLSWERYDRGWLTTDAVLKIGVKMPGDLAALNNWTIPLNFTVQHGPIAWRDNLRLGWFSGTFFLNDEHQAWVDQNLQVQGEGPFFVSKIAMDLAGNTTLQDRSLPFQITKEGETFAFSAYDGAGTVSRDGNIKYAGKLPSLQVTSATDNLSVIDLAFKVNSHFGEKVGQYAVPGSGEFSFKSFSAKTETGTIFNLQDVRVSSDLNFHQDKTVGKMTFTMGFSQAEMLEEKVTDAQLTFAFENLGLSFLNKYMEIIQQSQQAGEPNPMLAMQMMGLASSDLLPHGPKIRFERLGFTTSEGTLDFNGSVAVAPEAANATSNPMAILSHITVDAALTADKPLVFRLVRQSTIRDLNQAQFEGDQQMTEDEKQALADNQTQMKLDLLTIQGMLVDQGEKYVAKFHFEDGKAVINGQPLPLPF